MGGGWLSVWAGGWVGGWVPGWAGWLVGGWVDRRGVGGEKLGEKLGEKWGKKMAEWWVGCFLLTCPSPLPLGARVFYPGCLHAAVSSPVLWCCMLHADA